MSRDATNPASGDGISNSALVTPATPDVLRALAAAGLLPAAALERARAIIGERPEVGSWQRFTRIRLLLIGACLVAAGVIFFVAANWSALHPFSRMGLVAAALVIATVTGATLGFATLPGRAALLLGGLLFGPLMAIYGQTYQTGADAWELFALWAAVFTVHAVLSRFAVTWLIWLTLVHVAALTCIDQTLPGNLLHDAQAVALGGLVMLDAALAALAYRGLRGRRSVLLARVAATVAVVFPTWIGGAAAIDLRLADGQWLCASLLPVGWIALAALHRRRVPDLYMLFLLATSVLVIASGLAVHVLFDVMDADELGLWLMGVLICGEVWLLTRWLLHWRDVHERMGRRPKDSEPHGADGPRAVETDQEDPGAPWWRMSRRTVKPVSVLELADRLAGDGVLDQSARAALLGGAQAALAMARKSSVLDDAPWFVRLFVAAGTFVGAMLAGGFLIAFDVAEAPAIALPMGLAMIVVAALIVRQRDSVSLFYSELLWILVIGGQMLLLATAEEVIDGDDDPLLLIVAVALQIGCIAAVRLASLRIACTLALVIACSIAAMVFRVPLGQEICIALFASAAVACWIHESRIQVSPWVSLWIPAAYAVPTALLVSHGVLLLTRDDFDAPFSAPWALSLVLAGVASWSIAIATREARRRQETGDDGDRRARRARVLASLAALLIAGATHDAPGVTLGLILLLLSHLRRNRALELLALAHLAGALGVFYYQLSVSLLVKSLCILASGAVLLGAADAMHRLSGEHLTRARLRDLPGRRRDLLRAAALVALCLAIPLGSVVHKEILLADGEMIHLELRPRDPRSLMQGDYMVLRYALEEDVIEEGPDTGMGTIVVTLDERRVARFSRLDDGRALAPDERRLRARFDLHDDPMMRIGAESFFFEEGSAATYERARYGALVVEEGGRSVLVGLSDRDLRPLGAGRPRY